MRVIVLSALEPAPGEKRRSVQSLFEEIDEDDSGEIDMKEFEAFVLAQAARTPGGPQPTVAEIAQAFRFIDIDGSGEISSFEFHQIFAPGTQVAHT